MERKSQKMLTVVILLTAAVAGSTLAGEKGGKPYRLPRLYQYHAKIFWDSECRKPQGQGLAFGGSHSNANDGRPHTRILEGGKWKAIHAELRAKNLLQKLHDRAWKLRCEAKDIRARARFIYFTLNTVSTPQGALCWDKNGRVHLFDYKVNAWKPLKLSGHKLPGAVNDNSGLVYDSKRGRVLIQCAGAQSIEIRQRGCVQEVDNKSTQREASLSSC